MLSLFFSVLTVLSAFPTEDGQDPCTKVQLDGNFTSGSHPINYLVSSAKACLSSFPFDEQVRKETLDSVRKAMALYAFRDIAAYSQDGLLKSRIDILAELDVIENIQYESDNAFHNDLYSTFTSLNDAHTRYYSRCHHAAFKSYQPFVLTSILEDGVQKITVNSMTYPDPSTPQFKFWRDRTGVDLRKFVGHTVESIDGIDAMEAIRFFANTEVGTARDESVRFNLVCLELIFEGLGLFRLFRRLI